MYVLPTSNVLLTVLHNVYNFWNQFNGYIGYPLNGNIDVSFKDNTLLDVLCENMLEPQIKREKKRLVRADPKISFGSVRSEAIQLEDGLSGPHRSVLVREVHEPRHPSDDPSPLERIAAQLELLATTQSEIVFLLRAQQQTASGVAARTSRPEPRSSRSLHCEYCRRRGHTQNMCWKQASDIHRTDEQSGVHAYGDQSDSRAMRGGPVARLFRGCVVMVTAGSSQLSSVPIHWVFYSRYKCGGHYR